MWDLWTTYLRCTYDWYVLLRLLLLEQGWVVLMVSVRRRGSGYEDMGTKAECNKVDVSFSLPLFSPTVSGGKSVLTHARYPGMLDNVCPCQLHPRYGEGSPNANVLV